jgi:conjugative transfer signal peptidase TraF
MKRSKNVIILAGFVLALAGTPAALMAGGLRVNTTKSIPIGIYWAVTKEIERGDLVMFCPPMRPIFGWARSRGYIGPGSCKGGFGRLMKKVIGVPGDVIETDDQGMRVNGGMQENSAPLSMDTAGRVLLRFPRDRYVVRPDDVVVFGLTPRSFDSRYFGPINRGQVGSVIKPIWTWTW